MASDGRCSFENLVIYSIGLRFEVLSAGRHQIEVSFTAKTRTMTEALGGSGLRRQLRRQRETKNPLIETEETKARLECYRGISEKMLSDTSAL